MGLTWNDALNIVNPIQGMADITGYSANQLNQQQFKEQMDFSKYQFQKQIEMANSAHQREMADLKAAGLNPILTATGGQGAGNVSGTHMPGIPDNTATQKGMGTILNALMTIMPQVAEMKNANSAMTAANAQSKVANAQSTKLLAEAGKIATERDINEFIKQMKKYETQNFPRYYESQISKSPQWLLDQFKNLFKAGGDTAQAQNFEKIGESLYKFTESKPIKLFNKVNPVNRGTELLSLFLKLIMSM